MSEEKKEEKPAKAPSPPQPTGETLKQPASPQPPAVQARPPGPPVPVPPGAYRPVAQPGAAPRPPVPPGQVVRPPTPPVGATAAGQVPRPPGAQAAPPRPPVPPSAPRPAVPPQAPPKPPSRRGFVQFLSVLGAVLVLAPFVPWGEFLSASIKSAGKYQRQKIVIDNNKDSYKAAAGKVVNVNDMQTFPPNSHWVITYPSSGDSTLDAQNSDTFTKYELIRMPAEFGGDKKDASAFVAFSKVCVHLWCSPNYNPASGHQQYECPCHGSAYRVPDGKAVAGPAFIQPPPTNSIPILVLTADKDGTLNIEPPVWDVLHNGVLGYGRALYQDGKVNEYREAA